MRSKSKFIASTGLFIAVTVVCQSLSKLIPLGEFGNFITGSLVNACLLISTAYLGLWGGAAVGVITPLCAILTGSAIPIIFVPFIILGNFSIVLLFHLTMRYKLLRLLVPACVKTLILYASVKFILYLMSFPEAQAKMMLYLFGWPQLVTAVIGGCIAFIIIPRVAPQKKMASD